LPAFTPTFSYLNCEIKETFATHNLEAYGLEGTKDVEVCSMEDLITVYKPCSSGCFYHGSSSRPEDLYGGLFCLLEGNGDELVNPETGTSNFCACPCSILAPIVRPSVAITTVAYAAQTLVVSVVALNMGFRCYDAFFECEIHRPSAYHFVRCKILIRQGTFDKWRAWFAKGLGQVVGKSSTAPEPLPSDSRAYDDVN
jgi:hypothetical protein